jgi:hypothetical protein
VKKNKDFEPALSYIDRDPVFLLLGVVACTGLWLATCKLFITMNPWGFLLAVPTVFISYMLLWMMLRPFAIAYADRVEIRQTFFQHHVLYFNDISSIAVTGKGLMVTYKDDDIELYVLFGIRRAHVDHLRKALQDGVAATAAAAL